MSTETKPENGNKPISPTTKSSHERVPCSASDVEIVPRKVTMMADVLERQMRGERIAIVGGGQSWGKTMAMRIAMAASAQPMPLVIVDSKPND